jgi:hypothetical protein
MIITDLDDAWVSSCADIFAKEIHDEKIIIAINLVSMVIRLPERLSKY